MFRRKTSNFQKRKEGRFLSLPLPVILSVNLFHGDAISGFAPDESLDGIGIDFTVGHDLNEAALGQLFTTANVLAVNTSLLSGLGAIVTAAQLNGGFRLGSQTGQSAQLMQGVFIVSAFHFSTANSRAPTLAWK